MKRTLLAVGVAVLVSLMLVPQLTWDPKKVGITSFPNSWEVDHQVWRQPVFCLNPNWETQWNVFALQTAFFVILATVVVNIPWRRIGAKKS